jgi:uncharacterized phiE125 gp8 family phage protein
VTLVLVTPPATEPLTAAEAKEHLRVEHAADDGYIGGLIVAARRHVESVTWRALVTQTWELVLDAFPSGVFELAKGTIQSVESVKYFDLEGTEQTLAQAAYQVDTVREHGRVAPAPGTSWPSTADRLNAVRVRFVAGYGNADAVPGDVKAAMKLLIGHLYEHRESEVIGTIVSPLQFAVNALLAPHRATRYR